MSEYVLQKYAGILTEEDVETLFNRLMKELGNNRSKAARECKVTDKATYEFKDAAYIKLGTKRKVLKASLNKNFIATVEFLLDKSKDRNLDLLQTILSTLYADALESSSPDQFKDCFSRFNSLRLRNLGLIREGLENEVIDMSTLLKEKAKEFGVIPNPETINEFSTEELLNAVQLIGDLYSENPTQAEMAAQKDLGLPPSILKPIVNTFKGITISKIAKNSSTQEDIDFNQSLIITERPGLTNHYLISPRISEHIPAGGMIYGHSTSA